MREQHTFLPSTEVVIFQVMVRNKWEQRKAIHSFANKQMKAVYVHLRGNSQNNMQRECVNHGQRRILLMCIIFLKSFHQNS